MKRGDVVELRTIESAQMLVAEFLPTGEAVCQWHGKDGTPHSRAYHTDLLDLVHPLPVGPPG
jgi:uncharacterized protein YodC (DUF2158 family)